MTTRELEDLEYDVSLLGGYRCTLTSPHLNSPTSSFPPTPHLPHLISFILTPFILISLTYLMSLTTLTITPVTPSDEEDISQDITEMLLVVMQVTRRTCPMFILCPPVLAPYVSLYCPYVLASCVLMYCPAVLACCVLPTIVHTRGVQAAFLEIKSNLRPNQGVKFFSSQASNQIGVSNFFQIKPQIKSGRSNFHQIKSQIKPPA